MAPLPVPGLPQLICPLCSHQLQTVLQFKHLVENSRNVLISLAHKRSTSQHLDVSLRDNLKSEEVDNDQESPNEELKKHTSESSHLPYSLDRDNFTCSKCDRRFCYYKELVDHMPEHFPNKICEVCGKICASARSLLFHRKIHSEDRYPCSDCKKSFKTRRYLAIHTKISHKGGSLEYKCQECSEVFKTYNARVKHLVERHNKEDKIYKCNQCTKRYRLGSQLRAHVRSAHLQEREHTCSECGRAFFTKNALNKHSRGHIHQGMTSLKMLTEKTKLTKD